MPAPRLAIFLGNPGPDYARTRHNAAWLLADRLRADGILGDFREKKDFFGEIADGEISGEKFLALRPGTFMNLSGKSAIAAANFYKIPPAEIVAIFDEIQLPLGRVRATPGGGSAGGHNGCADLVRALGPDFARIRIGIGPLQGGWPLEKFVLGKFGEDEKPALRTGLDRAAGAFVEIWKNGVDAARGKWNGPGAEAPGS